MKIVIPDTTRRCEQCVHCNRSESGRYHCGKGLNPSLDDAVSTEREQVSQMAMLCDTYIWAPLTYPRYRQLVVDRVSRNPLFSSAALHPKFVPFYNESSWRLRVKTSGTQVWQHHEHGRVSVSTGHRPIFLLMRSIRAKSSHVVLEGDVKIVGAKRHNEKRYMAVEDPTC